MSQFEEIAKDFIYKDATKMRNMLNEIVDGATFYKSKDIDIEYQWYGDQTYYFVKDLKNQFYYIVTWYKSGEIGCILFQGEIIDKQEFNDFYNFLRTQYAKWILEKEKRND